MDGQVNGTTTAVGGARWPPQRLRTEFGLEREVRYSGKGSHIRGLQGLCFRIFQMGRTWPEAWLILPETLATQ